MGGSFSSEILLGENLLRNVQDVVDQVIDHLLVVCGPGGYHILRLSQQSVLFLPHVLPLVLYLLVQVGQFSLLGIDLVRKALEVAILSVGAVVGLALSLSVLVLGFLQHSSGLFELLGELFVRLVQLEDRETILQLLVAGSTGISHLDQDWRGSGYLGVRISIYRRIRKDMEGTYLVLRRLSRMIDDGMPVEMRYSCRIVVLENDTKNKATRRGR
ncbi:hypothetical protein F5Y02DRAFT_200902 [Annulohypoxylon stygium]|nr:hypothetical protein F5Y02DRAFT_200902 [Annulohypoxylon stygium]